MAKIRIVGDSSGYVELAAPNAAGNNTLELPASGTKLVGADASNNLNVTGIATFSGGIVGNLTGNATGLSGTPNITVGSIIASSATISGNVSVAGTVTYEDVTNVDSIGVVTARSGIVIGTGASISSPATNVLTLGTSNSERIRIGSTGSVGIGTNESYGDSNASFTSLSLGGNGTRYGLIELNRSDGTAGSWIDCYGTGGNGDLRITTAGTSGAITFWTGGEFTEKVRISSSGNLGIGITNPSAVLHARESNTKAPSLTWGASCGQIFRNEDSEFAFGLSNESPYPLWIQGRTNTNGYRDIVVNSLGGNFGVGVVPWNGTTSGLNFKTLVANLQAYGSMTSSSWADTSITLSSASNFVFAKIIAVGHENGRNNGFREYFVSWNTHAGWSTNLLVTSNQGNDYGLVDVRMNGSTVQVKAVNNASTGQYRLYVTYYLT